MKKKYIVELTELQINHLQSLIRRGKSGARVIRRAHVLLLAKEGKKDHEIASMARCSASTVQGIRQVFSEEGFEKALQEKPRSGRPEKLEGKAKAHLIALACSNPPEGQALWTLRLLADKVELDISHVAVYNTLKKMKLSLG